MNCPLYNNTEKAFDAKLEEKDIVLWSIFKEFSDRTGGIPEGTPLIDVTNLYINYLKDEYGDVFVGEVQNVIDSIVEEYSEKVEEQQQPEVRQDVLDLFEMYPILATIGTPEQYSQYLDTIFPDSKVKDIVYHGTNKFIGEVFIKDYLGEQSFVPRKREGFYFSNKEGISIMGFATRTVIPSLINTKNPELAEDIRDIKEYDINNDGAISKEDIGDEYGTYEFPTFVVFEPEQIHILGTKQDLQGFKEFVSQQQTTTTQAAPVSVDVYKEIDINSNNIVLSNIKTSEGKYDRGANIKEAVDNDRIYSMENGSDVETYSNPWASFDRSGTIKTNSTEESVRNYIDWLITDKFKDVKPERREWILSKLKSGELKGRKIQYYANLKEASHANALDYLINKYNWINSGAQSGIGSVDGDIQFNNNFNSYPERTAYNASHDATIHLGKDFSIPGEKLTFKEVVSQDKQYIPINIGDVEQEVSHSKTGSLRIKPTKGLNVTPELVNEIVDKLNEVNAKTLNIAGNGIYDLTDYKQEDIDKFTYDLLEAVLTSPRLNNKIEKVVSGGQTGFDEAGVKASSKLGIKSEVNVPKEWTFRVNSKDGDIKGDEAAFKARFKKQDGSGVGAEPQQNAPQGKVGFAIKMDKGGKDHYKAGRATKFAFGNLGKEKNKEVYGELYQEDGNTKGKSSTYYYAHKALQQGIPVNAGTYSKQDVVFVSNSGGNHALGQSKEKYDATISEIDKIIEAGASILLDSTQYVNKSSSSYVQGPYSEQAVVNYVLSKGYIETPFADGNVSVYSKKAQEPGSDIKRLPVRNKSEYVSPSNLNSSNIYSELDNEYLLSMLDDKGIVIGIRGKDVGNIPNTVYYAGRSNSDTLQMLKKSGVTEPNDIKEKIMFFSDSELSNYNKDLKKIDSTDESIKKSEKLITDFIGSLKKNKKTYIPSASKIDIHKSKNKVFVTGFINTFNKLKNKKIIVDLFEGTDEIKRYYRILEDEVSKKEIGTFEASITERLDDKEKNINPAHGSFGTLFHYAMEYFMKEDVPGSLEAKKVSVYDDKKFQKRASEYNNDNSILKVKWEVSSRQVVDEAYKLAKILRREFGNHYFLTEIPYAFNATNDPSKTTAGTIDLIAIDMNTGEGTIVDYKTSTKIAGEVDKYRKQLMVQALTLNLGNQSFKPINITGFTHVIAHKRRDNNKSVFSVSSSYNRSNLVKVENIKSNNSIYSIAGEVSEIYGVDLDLAMNAHEINNYINNIKPVDDIDNKLIEEYNEVDVFTNENIDIFVKKIDEHKNKNC